MEKSGLRCEWKNRNGCLSHTTVAFHRLRSRCLFHPAALLHIVITNYLPCVTCTLATRAYLLVNRLRRVHIETSSELLSSPIHTCGRTSCTRIPYKHNLEAPTIVIATMLSSIILAPVLLVATVLASPTHHQQSDIDAFRRMMDEISPSILHHVLHEHLEPKFQDGVFSKDRSALEHVHSADPAFATHLIHMAKRQSNGTSPASVTTKGVVVPAPTTRALAPSAPASATAISTGNGFVVYSTIGGGVVTLSSSVEVVSYTPVSSTMLSTYTLPDGSVRTSTSVTVVDAPLTGAASAVGTSTATSTPGLQKGDATRSRSLAGGIVAMVGGAAAVAMVL